MKSKYKDLSREEIVKIAKLNGIEDTENKTRECLIKLLIDIDEAKGK